MNKYVPLSMNGWITITMNAINGIWQDFHRMSIMNTYKREIIHCRLKNQKQPIKIKNIFQTISANVLDIGYGLKTNKIKTDINHTENSQSVLNSSNIKFYTHEEDRPTDIYSLDDILELCQLDTFPEEEKRILYDALERMYYSENLKIGDAILPQDKVRSRMYELNATLLHSVIDKLHTNDKQIKNITAYVMSTVFNAITEEYSLLHIDPYLNAMRRRE